METGIKTTKMLEGSRMEQSYALEAELESCTRHERTFFQNERHFWVSISFA